MDTLKFTLITDKKQVDEVCAMADRIWSEHYKTIISKEQIRYMLDNFQSPTMVGQQLDNGYQYYFFTLNDRNIGYMAVMEERNSLFLSKIYVEKQYRKKGFASQAISFLSDICVKGGIEKIWLTVNKNNHSSITAYEKIGFMKAKEQVTHIGNGYVMDDYVMEKRIG